MINWSSLISFRPSYDQDLFRNASAYGETLPVVYGTARVPGILAFLVNQTDGTVWVPDVPEPEDAEWDETLAFKSTTDKRVAAQIALCEGPILGLSRIWRDKAQTPLDKLVSNAPDISLSLGAANASSWLLTQAYAPVYRVPYSYTAMVRASSLGLLNGGIPDLSFEVRGFMPGVSVTELITNGGFADATGWTLSTTYERIYGGQAWFVVGSTGTISQSFAATPGRYRLKFSLPYLSLASYTRLRVTVTKAGNPTPLLDKTVGEVSEYHYDVPIDTAGTYTVTFTRTVLSGGGSGGTVSFDNVSFSQQDAHPADVILDYLTNPRYGFGLSADVIDVDHGADGLSASSYRTYCTAMGFFVSCAIEQESGIETLQNLLDSTNSFAVWSGGKLKILPLGDRSSTAYGATYTPSQTAVALTNDDFIVKKGEDPVEVERRSAADCFNVCPVEFKSRANKYASVTLDSPDYTSVATEGRKEGETFTSEWIKDEQHAQRISNIRAQRSTYIRNIFKFKLSWKYAALEPGDLVSVSETTLGLVNQIARIVTIEEDGAGVFKVEAEEWLAGVSTAITLSPQTPDGVEGVGDTTAVVPHYPVVEAKAAAEAAQATADSAAADAAQAAADAAMALALTGSETHVYHQASPPAEGLEEGDLWFSTDLTTDCPDANCKGHPADANGDAQVGTYPHRAVYWAHRWTGTAWVDAQGQQLVIASEIAAGAIVADKIAANAVTADKLYAGSVTAAKLAADAIKTSNFASTGSGASEVATAGAKMQKDGTALLVAAGGFRVGTRFIEDYAPTKVAGRIKIADRTIVTNKGISSAARVAVTGGYGIRVYFAYGTGMGYPVVDVTVNGWSELLLARWQEFGSGSPFSVSGIDVWIYNFQPDANVAGGPLVPVLIDPNSADASAMLHVMATRGYWDND